MYVEVVVIHFFHRVAGALVLNLLDRKPAPGG
jgi:hypothetical protein